MRINHSQWAFSILKNQMAIYPTQNINLFKLFYKTKHNF
ncbi:hypothetical protein CCAND38_620001 [Capnocytophaga canis]|uniref:Uncharacterized protein n=1 Tax=Capnocytophaga canis TaxID=1848903 RepID=A0A0B7IAD0_9FLAO|nr:hypothetical protein CCAND38_620001 [Capnocytophaga canis]